jgi:hypothetical protein
VSVNHQRFQKPKGARKVIGVFAVIENLFGEEKWDKVIEVIQDPLREQKIVELVRNTFADQ